MTPVPNARRDLFEAMKQVAKTGHGPKEQLPSMGCSIKMEALTVNHMHYLPLIICSSVNLTRFIVRQEIKTELICLYELPHLVKAQARIQRQLVGDDLVSRS
jgi:hypothetical protein